MATGPAPNINKETIISHMVLSFFKFDPLTYKDWHDLKGRFQSIVQEARFDWGFV